MWNYRVCKETHNAGTEWEEVTFSIREVYYNHGGDICSVTMKPVGMLGDTIAELKEVYTMFGSAFNKDVVDLDTIVFAMNDF